jgi:hypothetical protein
MAGFRSRSQASLVSGLVLLVMVAGCASSSDSVAPEEAAQSGDEIEVPDVTGDDGADSASEIENLGLTAGLEDQDGTTRDDGSGCTVEDQDPAGGDVAAEGDEVTLELDCRASDWENEEGTIWDEFTSGYETGFDEGCTALFDLSPDGSLYEDDSEYTTLDCPSSDVSDADKPLDVPDDPEGEGYDLGFEDGCNAIFDDVALTFELYHGDQSFTADDCQAENGSAGASRSVPNAELGESGDASRDCPPSQARSTYFSVRPVRGKVNCSGATALWKAYLSAARSRGQGSSAYTEIDGWGCLTAKIPEMPRLGSCSKKGTEFAVYEFSE